MFQSVHFITLAASSQSPTAAASERCEDKVGFHLYDAAASKRTPPGKLAFVTAVGLRTNRIFDVGNRSVLRHQVD